MKWKGIMIKVGLSVNQFHSHQHSRTRSLSASSKTDEDEDRNPGAREAVGPKQCSLGLRTVGSGRRLATVLCGPGAKGGQQRFSLNSEGKLTVSVPADKAIGAGCGGRFRVRRTAGETWQGKGGDGVLSWDPEC